MKRNRKQRQKSLRFLLLLLLVAVGSSYYLNKIPDIYAEESEQAIEKYAVDSFSWNGGSGRLKGMDCTGVWFEEEQAWAEIVIRSSNYTYIKADGKQYDRIAQTEHSSVFEIPVQLNENMPIIACTTAMSAAHEVEYEIEILFDLEADRSPLSAAEAQTEADEEVSEEEMLYSGEYTEKIHDTDAPKLPGLAFVSQMELTFAEEFAVFYYEEGYKVIRIYEDRDYLLVPEGKECPENLDASMVVLAQPLDRIYLAATASMALFDALDALDSIHLSSVQASGWYIEHAAEAMEEGKILFAGKYSEPDYELLIGAECDLAIESTMILHSPKVQEMIESMGIPVFIDRSSYESHPLGRTEWVKLYGAMLNKEEQAEKFFDSQAEIIDKLKDFQNTEQTVAFFYISSDGSVVVRKPEDYVPRMIEIAGGRYLFDHLGEDTGKKSSVNLTMEEFYATAIDADYLVYNATIDDPIDTLEELLQKDELFSDFKAVKNGNVWCAGKYLYQATDIVGNMITDLNLMLTGGAEEEMTFMTRIQ